MPSISQVLSAASCIGAAAASVIDLPITVIDGYQSVEADIGTPSRVYRLRFDTGSASSWVTDADCVDTTCINAGLYKRQGYSISNSSTANSTGELGGIDYLSNGLVAGPTVIDAWNMGSGDATLNWDQAFMAANQSSFTTLAADGFMGLSFGSIKVGGVDTVFETLMKNKLVDEPKFGIYYGNDINLIAGQPGGGVLTLGGTQEDEYAVSDGRVELPIVSSYNGQLEYDVWRVTVYGIQANRTIAGDNATTTTTTNVDAAAAVETESTFVSLDIARGVFDTGAGTIQLPRSKIEAVYEGIGMNFTAILRGEHLPLCSEFDDSWSVSFKVGEYSSPQWLTLTGSQLARPGFANREDACWPPFDPTDADYFVLFGTPLIRNFYTTWDYGTYTTEQADFKPTVSFSKLKTQPDWVQVGTGGEIDF